MPQMHPRALPGVGEQRGVLVVNFKMAAAPLYQSRWYRKGTNSACFGFTGEEATATTLEIAEALGGVDFASPASL